MGININLFDNVFIGSNSNEFHVYILEKKKNKNGEMEEYRNMLCHYSSLKSLLDDFLDTYLKKFSDASNFEELKLDIKYVQETLAVARIGV